MNLIRPVLLLILVFSQLLMTVARANSDSFSELVMEEFTPEQLEIYGKAQAQLLEQIITTTEGLGEISTSPSLASHIFKLKELKNDVENSRFEKYAEKRKELFIEHETEVTKVFKGNDQSNEGISTKSLISLASISTSVAGYAWQKIRGEKVVNDNRCLLTLELFMNQAVPPRGIKAWGRVLVDRMPQILFRTGAGGIATMTAIDMVDRYLLGGANALFNMASGLDALLIIALLPRPALKSFEGKFLGKVSMKVASFQQKASVGLVVGSGAYGLWQVLGAEGISEKLKNDGHDVSAAEIRTRGMTDLLISLWGGRAIYQEAQKRLLLSPFYNEFAKTQKTFLQSYWQTLKNLNPLKPVGHLKNVFTSNWKTTAGAWNGTKQLAAGSFYGGFQYFVYSTLALVAYGYPDFMLNANAAGIPELKKGEIAVELNGFASHDVLYYAMGGSSELNDKKQKLFHQGKLIRQDVQSPENFIEVLKNIGETKGRIRHLKIQSHGVPGILVFNAKNITGEGEILVNEKYLIDHRAELQEISRKYFAPDATIEIMSCLVGANLDEEVNYKGMHFNKDAGDRFVSKLGETLLVNGGRIESLKRFVFGMEATYGAFYGKIVYGDYRNTPVKVVEALPPVKQSINSKPITIEVVNEKNQDEKPVVETTTPAINTTVAPDYTLLTTSAGKRVWSMFFILNEVTYKFGVNLKGPYWADAFRRDEFLPQE